MEALRVVVADDEAFLRDCVRLALDGADDIEVVAECDGGREAVQAIRRHRPDLVFLDVQIPNADGFEVLENLGLHDMPSVVFLTIFDRHAVRAFEVHAVDHGLKPVEDARILDAADRARQRREAGKEATLHERLVERPESERPAEGYATRIMVRDDDRIRFVPTDRVDWIEAAGNYIRLHCGTDVHKIRATLSGTLERLDPVHFARIHRSTIVRIDAIKEVQPWFGGDYLAILRNDTQLKVSRRYRDRLLRPLS